MTVCHPEGLIYPVSLLSSSDPALRYAALTAALDSTLPLLPVDSRASVVSGLAPRVKEDLRLFDCILPTGAGGRRFADANSAAIRLRSGEDGRSYDLFPLLACRRYLALCTRDPAGISAIY